MKTVTLTYTHPVFGTVTSEYPVVREDGDLVVLRSGDSIGTITTQRIKDLHGVWGAEPTALQRFAGLFK